MRTPLLSPAIVVAAFLALATVPAAADDGTAPARGVGVSLGAAYDPEPFPIVMATAFLLLDYDSVVWHRAPDPLRLKIEGSVGTAAGDETGLIASANALASFTVDVGSLTVFPYAEAGIGLVYTSFRVEGQGLHLNFNPQAALGLEFREDGRPRGWIALRLHHVSNGGTNEENRGINSLLVQTGTMF